MENDDKIISTLYIVGTPIGNLEDITYRAVKILKEVDYILCEDTRTTQVLLNKYNINTKTISYHSYSTPNKEDEIINLLKAGKNLALVSEAGTPCISDPGLLLVSRIKRELKNKVAVSPIPGPSALISALSASGVSSAKFTFLGFMPHKKGREKIFKEIAESKNVIIFYESTHRILKTLISLNEYTPKHKIIIAREMTKKFEEFMEGQAKDLIQHLEENNYSQKGEFVVIVEP